MTSLVLFIGGLYLIIGAIVAAAMVYVWGYKDASIVGAVIFWPIVLMMSFVLWTMGED